MPITTAWITLIIPKGGRSTFPWFLEVPCHVTSLLDHKLLQMPGLYELFQMILENSTLFGGMTFLSRICAILVLIPPRWVPSHLTQPLKLRFVFLSAPKSYGLAP